MRATKVVRLLDGSPRQSMILRCCGSASCKPMIMSTGIVQSYHEDAHDKGLTELRNFNLTSTVFYASEMRGRLVRKYIEESNYVTACNELFKAYTSNDHDCISLITTENIKKLLDGMSLFMVDNPKRYIWLAHLALWNFPDLDKKTYLNLLKFHIRSGLYRDFGRIYIIFCEKFKPIGENIVRELFFMAYDQDLVGLAEIVIRYGYDPGGIAIRPSNSTSRYLKAIFFARLLFKIKYISKHSDTIFLKHSIFLYDLVNKKDVNAVSTMISLIFWVIHFHYTALFEKELEVAPTVLRECQKRLVSLLFHQNEDSGSVSTDSIIRKYISDAKSIFTGYSSYRFDPVRLLTIFLHACNADDFALAMDALSVLTEHTSISGNIKFLVTCVSRSPMTGDHKARLIALVVSTAGSSITKKGIVEGLSNIVVSINSPHLLKQLFSTLNSLDTVGSDLYDYLNVAAIRINQDGLLNLCAKKTVSTNIYSSISDPSEKVSAAISILKFVDDDDVKSHIIKVLFLPNVYENMKRIMVALVECRNYERAVCVFSFVNSRYPAFIEEIGEHMVLDVIHNVKIHIDEALESFLALAESREWKSQRVIATANKFIKDITELQPSPSTVQKLTGLLKCAIQIGPSNFSGFLGPIVKKFVSHNMTSDALNIFYLLLDSCFVSDKTHLEQISGSYKFLASHLLDKTDWCNLKDLYSRVLNHQNIISVGVGSNDLPLPAAILSCIDQQRIGSTTTRVSSEHAQIIKEFTELFYSALTSKPATRRMILDPLNKMLELSKARPTYVRDSLLGNEFDEALHDTLLAISRKNVRTYSIGLQKCLGTLLEDRNRKLISKDPTIMNIHAISTIVECLLKSRTNDEELCKLMETLGPEAAAAMRLSPQKMWDIIDILLKKDKYLAAFSIIEKCVLADPTNSNSLDEHVIAFFVDACITNDRLYLTERLLKMKNLSYHVSVFSPRFLDITLKYSISQNNFDDALKIIWTIYEALVNRLKATNSDKRRLGSPNPGAQIARLSGPSARASDTANHAQTVRGDQPDMRSILHSTDKPVSAGIISISTLIYSLRIILLHDRLDILKPFMLYIYRASELLSESAFSEITRTLVLSRNYGLAQITLQIMSQLSMNVLEPAFQTVFNALVSEGNLATAWRLFNSCCITAKQRNVSDIISKKLLITLYSKAKSKMSPSSQLLCREIEAFNNKQLYSIGIGIEEEIMHFFSRSNLIAREYENTIPSYYPVKRPLVPPFFHRNSRIVAAAEINRDPFVNVNIDDINGMANQVVRMAKSIEECEPRIKKSRYLVLLERMYESNFSPRDLGKIITRLIDGGHRMSTKALIDAAKYLDLRGRSWFLLSLECVIDTHMKSWLLHPISYFCHYTALNAPVALIRYMISINEKYRDLERSLRFLVSAKIAISEAILYHLYVYHKSAALPVAINPKIFRRLIMALIRSGNPPTYRSLETVLYMCHKSKDPNYAKFYWNLLVTELRVSPTLKCYDILMETLYKFGGSMEACGILLNLIKSKQIPDYRYNKVHVQVLVNAGLFKQALDLASTICASWRKLGMYTPAPIDAPTLTAILHGVARNRCYLDTLNTRSLTYIFNITMDILKPFWSSLINDVIDRNDYDTMDVLFSAIGEKALSIWGFNTAVRIFIEYIKKGALKKSELIYVHLKKKMMHKAVPYGVIEEAIQILCSVDICNEAIYTLRRLFNILTKHQGVLPSRDTIEAILNKHLEINSIEFAEYYLSILDEMGMGLNHDICAGVVSGWADTGMYKRAVRLDTLLTLKGMKSNSRMIFASLWTYLHMRNKAKATSILREIASKGYSFDEDKLLKLLVFEAYNKRTFKEAFIVWSSNVKAPKDELIAMESHLNIYAANDKITDPDGHTFPATRKHGLHLNPRILSSKYLWAVKGSDTVMSTGILPPDFASGSNKEVFLSEFYDPPPHIPRVAKNS